MSTAKFQNRHIRIILLAVFLLPAAALAQDGAQSWIRVNLMGYRPDHAKNAVWCSKSPHELTAFHVVEVASKKVVFTGKPGNAYGAYGPFQQTYRLDFSVIRTPGKYYLEVGTIRSPEFSIGEQVYDGAADFCLRYMRQQRTGFNPYLRDSCHTHDGYVLYGSGAGINDSTHVDVVGGWHDASDYLQYATTSANATYHLLAAYRDFPNAFYDHYRGNGLRGRNDRADILDEAQWGLDWLLKMHPSDNVMFNQIGDDRDHYKMRMPGEDNVYGRGYERPVYFINGEVQQRGKFLNNTKGTSSTAAKMSSAFALGAQIFSSDVKYADLLKQRSISAWNYALNKPGVTQTVSVRSPYIYAEDNWVDDMELAAASLNMHKEALTYAAQEPTTPWLGADTASHYQWYPFINVGHFELARRLNGKERDQVIDYYKQGIQRVATKASKNAFNRGVPFIWCSNNLATSFAIQCFWYKLLTGDTQFEALEQANLDWLFGCNPWGTSMVYGLPAHGDTPLDPHSAFTHIKNFPIDGGLVDGPVYTSIYKNLIGIQLVNRDEYAEFQSNLAVYHDDYGDYSTNEPTMDGTASLIYLLAAKGGESPGSKTISQGALVRGDSTKKHIALIFTADEYFEGLSEIQKTLKSYKIPAGFFFTGRLYANPSALQLIRSLAADGHYLGPHSDRHLLYNDWAIRDSLLVTRDSLLRDLKANLAAMERLGITYEEKLFVPPFEWWNSQVANWCADERIQLVSFTSGTFTNADYTFPEMGKQYRSNRAILDKLFEQEKTRGLNGAILLIHAGTDPRRKEKLYQELPALIKRLKDYQFKRIDEFN